MSKTGKFPYAPGAGNWSKKSILFDLVFFLLDNVGSPVQWMSFFSLKHKENINIVISPAKKVITRLNLVGKQENLKQKMTIIFMFINLIKLDHETQPNGGKSM